MPSNSRNPHSDGQHDSLPLSDSTVTAPETPSSLPFFVVGLGASAGGLEALEQFFDRLPASTGCAFVVIQHLSPDHKSLMAELLGRHTTLPVARATDGVRLEPDHVYLNEASHNVLLEGDRLRFVDRSVAGAINLPIDLFFDSLSRAQGPRSIAIVLSGTGSDGMRGVRSVKRAGGLVFVQDSLTARFDGMPRSAVATGIADAVVAPGEMPGLIIQAARDPNGMRRLLAVQTHAPEDDQIGQLLEMVGRATAVDFSHYKRGTVMRRVARRLAANNCQTLDEYLELVRRSPQEIEQLRRDLLIGVTRFFRDTEVFTALQERVIRPLIENAPTGEPVRVWIAGCATGEEAYTFGIILLEEMERCGRQLQVRILATDLDEAALEIASVGAYGPHIADDLTPDRLARFFEWRDGHYVVRRELRQTIVVAHHNLVSDPPFTRIALLSCRNVLIYLDQTLQARVLAGFRFALRTGGTLLLGPSESVGDLVDCFRPIDSKLRIFESTGTRPIATELLSTYTESRAPMAPPRTEKRPRAIDEATASLLRTYAPGSVLITEHFRLVHVFGDMSPWLHVPAGDVDLNLLTMAPRSLAALLSAAVPRALRHNQESVYAGTSDDFTTEVPATIRVVPLTSYLDGNRLVLVSFETARPVTRAIAQDTELVELGAREQQHLAELQQELRHSRENLQAMVEELETANEELQATNEELTSSNEELHSTNEELQSVNEELHTVNTEYARQIQQLEQLHNDIDNILRSSDIGTLLLDEHLTIRKFTAAATAYIKLMDHDVGRPIDHLALHLGGPAFLDDVRAVLQSGRSAERRLSMGEGRHVLIRMTPYLAGRPTPTGVVVSFIDITSIAEANARTQKVLDSMPQQIAMLDRTGTIVMVNAAWSRFARENGATDEERIGVGMNYLTVCSDPALPENSEGHEARVGLERLMAGEIEKFVLEYPCHSSAEQRWFMMHAVRINGSGGAVVSHIDITERKLAELNLRELTMVDPLTGTLNRRGLAEVLIAETDRAKRSASTLTAILIDCDNFKDINDRFGHAAGDLALATLSRRLSEVLRPSDRLARVGGDEFIVLLPDTRLGEAALVADRLRHSAAQEGLQVGTADVPLTVSIAVTPVDTDVFSIEDILTSARTSLSESKRHGKNRVTLSTPNQAGSSVKSSDIGALLRSAQALSVSAQPIMHLRDNSVVGYEMLTRGPEGPLNMPEHLFRRAGEDGLLTALDLRCLRACLSAASALTGWRHVNLYPSTLIETPVEQLVRLFPERREGHAYCVELSEQQLLGAPSALREAAAGLRRSDVKLAIDDVGFGRTSLEHLVLLEPEIVKIDRKWVAGISHDRARLQTLKRLVEVAHALNATVVAEGIERAEDVGALLDLGVTMGQGYLWGTPASVDDVKAWRPH